jgi:hypothetical protein
VFFETVLKIKVRWCREVMVRCQKNDSERSSCPAVFYWAFLLLDGGLREHGGATLTALFRRKNALS